jgi:DUF1680 family protein
MIKSVFKIIFLISIGLFSIVVQAQEKLYTNTFPLSDVKLLDGPFKHARDLNIEVLLKYDVDRLLQPFFKEAGLKPKAEAYPNWAGLDGHVGGHYLSALAMNYASTGNQDCRKKMEYMISELKICQDANALNNPEWGDGYVGGAPNSKNIWTLLKKGDFGPYKAAWVPWYNVHKMYAGLRDAWLYAGNEDAKAIFLKFCDWGLNITSNLSDDQMQSMLDMEHGGMNEIFADAYQMTGDKKYIIAAKRFSHNMLLNSMAEGKDNLDNKHANTQVPKVVGFQRIAELTNDKKYVDASYFFWKTVSGNRSLSFGGNSRREFFPSASACEDFVSDVEGPETCNTYNMLKLTEDLFRKSPKAEYMDFFERAMFNHILSTQHPEHGGYVYFTPARPRHYRVYSAPNEAMWCCVGSGMENHGKYNQEIFTHSGDSLFVNLFIHSELNWKAKKMIITQETGFPYQEKTLLTINKGSGSFCMMIRYPSWIKGKSFEIRVNGKKVDFTNEPSSYISVKRKWKKGDTVEVKFKMSDTIEHLPNVPGYISVMHGPILLGAKTGTNDLYGLVANDSRWGHIASGKKLPVDKAPIIIEDNPESIASKLVMIDSSKLTFRFKDLKFENQQDLVLEPFSNIHDARYIIYWMNLTNRQYRSYLDSVAVVENEKIVLQNRTIDFVSPGEQQPEVDHAMQSTNSRTGNNSDEFFREANNGGSFSYRLATNKETNLALMVRYRGNERGRKNFEIYVDDQKLITEDLTDKWKVAKFYNVEYQIPEAMLKGKDFVRVKFQSVTGNTTGAIYGIRILKK